MVGFGPSLTGLRRDDGGDANRTEKLVWRRRQEKTEESPLGPTEETQVVDFDPSSDNRDERRRGEERESLRLWWVSIHSWRRRRENTTVRIESVVVRGLYRSFFSPRRRRRGRVDRWLRVCCRFGSFSSDGEKQEDETVRKRKKERKEKKIEKLWSWHVV